MELCPGSRLVTPQWEPCRCNDAESKACNGACVWVGNKQECYSLCTNGRFAEDNCACASYGTYVAEYTPKGGLCGPYGGTSYGCGQTGVIASTQDCVCTSKMEKCTQTQICYNNNCYEPCPAGVVEQSCFCGYDLCTWGYACVSSDDGSQSSGNEAGVVCAYNYGDYFTGDISQQAAYCNSICFGDNSFCDYGECMCRDGSIGPCSYDGGHCELGQHFENGTCVDSTTPLPASTSLPSERSEAVAGRCGGINNAVVWAGHVCLKVGEGMRLLPRCPFLFEVDEDCACETKALGLVALARGSVCQADGSYYCADGDCLAKFVCEIPACQECNADGSACVKCNGLVSENIDGDCLPIMPSLCVKAAFTPDGDSVTCTKCEIGCVLYKNACYFHGSCTVGACVQCAQFGDKCMLCNEEVAYLEDGECLPKLSSNCAKAEFLDNFSHSVCIKCAKGYYLEDRLCYFDEARAKREHIYLIVGVTVGAILAVVGFVLAGFFRAKSAAQQKRLRFIRSQADRAKRRRLKALRASRAGAGLVQLKT